MKVEEEEKEEEEGEKARAGGQRYALRNRAQGRREEREHSGSKRVRAHTGAGTRNDR